MEKPIKPELSEFNLDEDKIQIIKNLKLQSSWRANLYMKMIIGSIVALSILMAFITDIRGEIIFVVSIILFFVIVIISKRFIDENYIFEKSKKSSNNEVIQNIVLFEASMRAYDEKNRYFEKIISRGAWRYWLSLNPTDFEDAVGDLFTDQGFEVTRTKSSGDQGVDLFLKKEGKKIVVQCKTYKKVIGPNVVRDLYGTMFANDAIEAILVAPGGFSNGTKEFCRGKPIKLIDLDDLTQMTYNFERYTPHWIDKAKSIDDLMTGIKKLSSRKKGYGRRY
jgi:HJR/Mrr/RecB family endonuclease